MRHLIIGTGNMGKRHGSILEELGDEVDSIDINDPLEGWLSSKYTSIQYDSALICTPPETHVAIINRIKTLRGENLPLFCEKPLYTKKCRISYKGLSMVACNWRWCTCLHHPGLISYPNAKALDMIHFVDMIWEQSGKPYSVIFVGKKDMWDIVLRGNLRNLPFWFGLKRGKTRAKKHKCLMFVDQMKNWRQQIEQRIAPINPFSKAKERTDWLIDLIARKK